MEYVELTDQDRTLLHTAVETVDRLYLHPIQDVAAAVRTASGEVFSAICFDADEPWASTCGEVAALACMVAAGHRDLETIVAVWRDPQGRHFLLPPCGRCRAAILPFNRLAWVIVTSGPNHWEVGAIDHPCKVRISDLVPLPFKP
jgi:cytidine deaminase